VSTAGTIVGKWADVQCFHRIRVSVEVVTTVALINYALWGIERMHVA